MDIIICGFDSESIAWLKECCADYTIIESNNEDEAHILICEKFFDPNSYNHFLKKHKGKRYILHPGVPKAVLQNIALLLKENHSGPTQGLMPPALQERYNDSIYEKIVILNELSNKIDGDNLKAIRNEVHKIAGSAGSFGYPEMTILSRHVELELNHLLEGTSKMSDDEIRKMLVEYQTSLKLAFQNILHI